ncbi:integrase [Terrimonas sp.]|uniref:tyrosine-type recombinase/integrase n=1 Tax=Terrimonas sp. TaxID=1914338 RepID=UPI000D506DEE|nr:tyrosine-type recombinase/integrase [Terrimonas sp.]PVD49451.1 integrase [Terrimonas sp.]
MQNTKQKIRLTPLLHRGNMWIGIHFPRLPVLQQAVRKTRQIKWSQSNKCWYIPFNRASYDELLKNAEPFATIDNNALKQYKAAGTGVPASPVIKAQALYEPTYSNSIKPAAYINPVNRHVLPAMRQTLVLKAYSPSTIKTYLNEMSVFLQALKSTRADELSVNRIKSYLQYCFEKLKLSENTLHSRINALKFYYEQVLKKEKFFWEIPRPKKLLQLPHFFNQDEITSIIKSAGNIKHKTMLMLAYSSGLRVSEVVNLRTADIDSRRMTIMIQQAKGKKDRIVKLSPVLLIMLREYWKKAKPSLKGYLFPGQYPGEPYSSRSLQLVLAAAKKKGGILKPGSIHALRHSFATHLLDRGTDVTLIMKLLGHNDIKTTLRYLHVTNRDMLQIISPLDDLKL